jgi:hypothetical protein
MKTSERPSKQVHVRNPLHQQLHIYALAASAAGVSMLALARPSEAEIIYTKEQTKEQHGASRMRSGSLFFGAATSLSKFQEN